MEGFKSEKRVCKFYLQGKCTKDDCEYSHEDSSRPRGVRFDLGRSGGQESQGKQLICSFFQKGNCDRGSSCKFRHEGEDGNDENDNKDEAQTDYQSLFDSSNNNNNNKLKKPCFKFAQGQCTYGDDCKFMHSDSNNDDYKGASDDETTKEPEQRPKKSNQICRSYLQGFCKYGEKCIHEHVEGGNPSKQHEEIPIPREFEQKYQKTTQVCRNFLQGRCQYGENCRFSHEEGGEGANSQSQQNPNGQFQQERQRLPCRFFQQYGSCKKGEDCHFSHSDAEASKIIKNDPGSSLKEADKELLKTRRFRFSVLKIGKQVGLNNPKELFSVGACRLVAFFENGFILLRMTSKKFKEKLLKKKQEQEKHFSGSQMEEENDYQAQDTIEEQNGGLILEVIDRVAYPIEKVIANKVFLKARRWVLVSFENPILKTFGFLSFDLLSFRKEKLKRTACLAVQVAHAGPITSVEFCLKNEIFDDRLQKYVQSNESNFNPDDERRTLNEIPETKQEKDRKLKERQQKWIKERIQFYEQEFESHQQTIFQIDKDEQLQPEEKEIKKKEPSAAIHRCEVILTQLSALFDSISPKQNDGDEQQYNDEHSEDDDNSANNQRRQDNDGHQQNKSQQNQNQNQNEEDKATEDISFEYEDSCEEEEQLLQEKQESEEEDYDDNVQDSVKKSSLANNFYFESLLVESLYARSLSDLILLTSSTDGMVKVWQIEAKPKVKDSKVDALETKSKEQTNKLKKVEEIEEKEEKKKETQPKKDLTSDFKFNATLNENLSKQISDSILKQAVIRSMLQLTTPAKRERGLDGCLKELSFNRILLLGGEKGLMYSIGLNFSLSKVSQIGSTESKIDQFFVSEQNQIFCVINEHKQSQVHQIGRDSSEIVSTMNSKIDVIYSQIEKEKDVSIFYGTPNQLIQQKGVLGMKTLSMPEELRFKKFILDKLIENIDEEIKKSKEIIVPVAEVQADAENQTNIPAEGAKAPQVLKSVETQLKESEQQMEVDLTQAIRLDEKQYSEGLQLNDRVSSIVEININKDQNVLFAFVLNEAQNIAQDAYLFNFDCKISTSRTFQNRRTGGNLNKTTSMFTNEKHSQDRTRERSEIDFKKNNNSDNRSSKGQLFGVINKHLNHDDKQPNDKNKRSDSREGDQDQNNDNSRDPSGRQQRVRGNIRLNNQARSKNSRQDDSQRDNSGRQQTRRNDDNRRGERKQNDYQRRDGQSAGGEGNDGSNRRGERMRSSHRNQSRGGQSFKDGNKSNQNRSGGSSWNNDKIQQ